MRIDQLLVQQGVAASRSQAQRLIAAGVSWRLSEPAGNPWRAVRKSGDDVPESAELQLADDSESRYVSRGGLKLEGALAVTGVSAQGKLCLDVGQSTGGFTDCLLQAGAAHVVGVDVGHSQVHPRIEGNPLVSCVQRVNARELTLEQLQDELQSLGHSDDENSIADNAFAESDEEYFDDKFPDEKKSIAVESMPEGVRGVFSSENGAPFALIVGDLSFISQTLVLPALVPLLAEDGDLLMLVKPQFELQPQDIGKGGLVRDPAAYAQVEQRLRTTCAILGLQVVRWFDSPIAGGDGNREFFMHARFVPTEHED
jgi:23S rRNA (cytidine1920-2'-O)/16S rRNA (cytidine1409-2'-O)-methyltransferase